MVRHRGCDGNIFTNVSQTRTFCFAPDKRCICAFGHLVKQIEIALFADVNDPHGIRAGRPCLVEWHLEQHGHFAVGVLRRNIEEIVSADANRSICLVRSLDEQSLPRFSWSNARGQWDTAPSTFDVHTGK